MVFHARHFEFRFPRRAIVMGIVNVTPDSFSDGGQYYTPARAVAHALQLEEQGADVLDVGGESTRPGAVPVSEEEEIRRVLPVIERLVGKAKVPISIDTMKPPVARAALSAGASIVNDVAASRADTDMWDVVADAKAGYVLMHAQGSPQTMQKNPRYRNVVREIRNFFRDGLATLTANGIGREQIILDPGIGFGKTPEHNLILLAHLRQFVTLGRPLLLGVSRKSFLEKFSNGAANERLPASLACAILAIESGVRFIRAHDVLETVQAIRMAEAVLAKNS